MSKNDGTPPEITAILNWQKTHAGQVPYSETASTRLASDTAHLTSATDCSGMVARMFAHFAGLNVGTWTGNERNYGTLVTTSKADAATGKGMLPGDVVLFNWSGPNPNFDHIAIYAGAGRIWNHGGPGKGPLDWSLASNVNAATNVMVRRFITPTTANAQEDDMSISKFFRGADKKPHQVRTLIRTELAPLLKLAADQDKRIAQLQSAVDKLAKGGTVTVAPTDVPATLHIGGQK